ncbi:MAG: Flp pilus assembly complex ATPase component TadA [Phycisphaerae bacterium]|nr:Flp pilus assembly complex ATPase component TadA [Phycisphaerae bacterium]
MLELEIREEGESRKITLPPSKVTIGRRADNTIVIEDKLASRYHCSLEPTEGGFILCDLGSRNGTKVNGERVERALVGDGDEIAIGHTVMTLVADGVGEVTVLEELAEAEILTEAEPIPMAILEDTNDSSAIRPLEGMTGVSVGAELRNLARAGRDIGFDVNDVAMLNRQGQAVHPAGKDREDAAAAVRALRMILFGAFRTRATDIHIEPRRTAYQVRFRVDGTMLPVLTPPVALGQAILSVVKVLCELDISKRHIVQDGNFTARVPGRQIDFRISFSPTTYGQKLVIRVLDKTAVPTRMQDLGMPEGMLRSLRGACNMDSGMIVVSGPTGSGKTTTLYTAIRTLDATAKNVVTIEDPVEYQLDGVTQCPVDNKGGLTFANLLISMLRQDPDVILVGEIRDPETARTAIQAAMTGHLVFTTLHARDTIGSIFRLMDLGVEPYMVANAVTMCLSQRLVRVLCEGCRKPFRPSPSQLVRMKMENKRVERLYTHVGCRKCMNVGYLGRTAIFELLSFSDQIRDAILTQPTIHQIRKAAGEYAFQTLVDSGYAKVAEGVTTIDEVERVAVQD